MSATQVTAIQAPQEEEAQNHLTTIRHGTRVIRVSQIMKNIKCLGTGEGVGAVEGEDHPIRLHLPQVLPSLRAVLEQI